MYQRLIFIFFIISFQNIANAQTDTCFEQIALDYFTEKLLDTSNKEIKYYIFDGIIYKTPSNSYDFCSRDTLYGYRDTVVYPNIKLDVPDFFTEKFGIIRQLLSPIEKQAVINVFKHSPKEDEVIVVISYIDKYDVKYYSIFIHPKTKKVIDSCVYRFDS